VKPSLVAAVLAVVVTAACTFVDVDPDNTAVNSPTQVITTASPAPSPSPGTGSSGGGTCVAAASVRVGFYGFNESCADRPRNAEGVLPVGCTGFATATPKGPDGADQPFALHSSAVPQWRVAEGAAALLVTVQSNPFNADIAWRSGTPAGTRARVETVVCGVTGAFEFVAR
jgi:hypothetical protein